MEREQEKELLEVLMQVWDRKLQLPEAMIKIYSYLESKPPLPNKTAEATPNRGECLQFNNICTELCERCKAHANSNKQNISVKQITAKELGGILDKHSFLQGGRLCIYNHDDIIQEILTHINK